ncbi:MAG: hypothetical protein IT427_01905 [Pirellulales bacterium]|nr:hypothetical protein [Pirellulales bacterium]
MRTNRGKRLYVFGAVSLAVFVILMTLTGILSDGFASADRAKALKATETWQADVEATKRAKSNLAEIEASLAAALDKYNVAHQQFTRFLSEHFTELARANSKAATQQPVVENSAIVEQNQESRRRTGANPAWERANQQLAELRRRRTELLTNFTESHPLVRQMEMAIRDGESQLRLLALEVSEMPQAAQPKSPAISAETEQNWQIVNEHYRTLLEQVEAAEMAYQSTLQTEQSARQSFERLTAALKAAPRQLVTAGGASPRLSIYLCGLIAIAAGVLVGRSSQAAEITFHTAAEVRQSLGVAVLGVLPGDPYIQPRERPKNEPVWVRRLVGVAELSLAAAVLVLTISAMADRQFLFDLIADPLAACSNKYWC